MVANDSGGGQLALEEGDEELQIPMSVASDGHGTMKHSAVGEGDGSDPSSEAVEDEEEKSGGEGAQNGGVLVKPAAKKKRNLPGTPDPGSEVIALSAETLMATNRFLCEICHKGFQRDQNLQLHRRGHNLPWKLRQRSEKEQRRRVYVCPEKACVHHDPARALGDLTGIKKHYCRKHGEKKFKCDKCSKKYAVQSDWKAHQKTCGMREYRCDCGTLFSRRDSFVTHRAFCDALAGPTDASMPSSAKPGEGVSHPLGQSRGLTRVLEGMEDKPLMLAAAGDGGGGWGQLGVGSGTSGGSSGDANGFQSGNPNWNPNLALWIGQDPGQSSGQNGMSTSQVLQESGRMGAGLGGLSNANGMGAGMDISADYLMQQQHKGLGGFTGLGGGGRMGTSSNQILNMDFSNVPAMNRGQISQESLYSNLFRGTGNSLQGLMGTGGVGGSNASNQQSSAVAAAMRTAGMAGMAGMDVFSSLGAMGMANTTHDNQTMGNFANYANQMMGNGLGSLGAGMGAGGGGLGGLTAGKSNFQALQILFAQGGGGGDSNSQQNQNMTAAGILQQMANLSAMNGGGGLAGTGQVASASTWWSGLLGGDTQAQLAALQSLGVPSGSGGMNAGQLQQLLGSYGGMGAGDGVQESFQMQAQRQAASLANLYGMSTAQKPVNTQSIQDMLAMASSQGLLPPGGNLSELLNSGQLQAGGGGGGGGGGGADFLSQLQAGGARGGGTGDGVYNGFANRANDDLKALAEGAVTRDFMGLSRGSLSPQDMAVLNQVSGGGQGGNQNQIEQQQQQQYQQQQQQQQQQEQQEQQYQQHQQVGGGTPWDR